MNLPRITNWPIFISSLLLFSVGVLTIYSSSSDLAFNQLLFAIIGLILFFFISRFDYRATRSFIPSLYIVILILLIVVLVLGIETRGSVRWISIGLFNMQPSEFAKPVLILLLANFWSKNLPTWRNIFISLLWIVVPLILVFKQPDLGSAMTLLAIWIGMLLATKASIKKVFLLFIIFVLTVPAVWFTLEEYQQQRIYSFISPSSDPLGVGYNIIQSTIAVGSGQLTGRGLGHGTQSRLQFLPEFRTDFIFASISEELGFIGSTIILLLYLFLIGYLLKTAGLTKDTFGFYIILGVVSMLLFQITVNIGMNIGLLPITGITLPLISYGGSSLVTTLLCLGLIASVIRFTKKN